MTEPSDPSKTDVQPGDPGPDEDGPKIDASSEMEAALREAEQSMDARKAAEAGGKGNPGPDNSPDKLTIELLSSELQSLKEEFDTRSKELEEAKDRHLRVQAEMENFRRRMLKEKQESLQYGNQNLVKDLLGVVDNLERAIGHANEKSDAELQGLLQGVELVHRELLGVLGKHGVKLVEAQDRPFDPQVHEAMGQVADDTVPNNTVVQVLQTGYQLHDRLIRPARVMVTKESAPGKAPKTMPGAAGAESASPAQDTEGEKQDG